MRRAPAGFLSSMQSLAVAGLSSAATDIDGSRVGTAAQHNSNFSSYQNAQRGQRQHKQQQKQGSTHAADSGCLPLFSYRVRRRRLMAVTATAVAQPGLATDNVEAAWKLVQVQGCLPPNPPPTHVLPRPGSKHSPQQLWKVQQQDESEEKKRSVPLNSAAAAAAAELQQVPMPNPGYTCLNKTLHQQHGMSTNRYCWRRTFETESLPRVSRLVLANCRDLLPVVEWKRQHSMQFFCVPSILFFWSHEYELEELPDFEKIVATLAAVGVAARSTHQRLTAQPSHFVQLASFEPALSMLSLQNLKLNPRVFDLKGYAPSHTNKINIHVGATHGTKQPLLARFVVAVDRFSHGCRTLLTVENDDCPNVFSMADLLLLHAMVTTPLIFDYLHHMLLPGGLSEEEALLAVLGTWPQGIRPVVRYSEPFEKPALRTLVHADSTLQPVRSRGRDGRDAGGQGHGAGAAFLSRRAAAGAEEQGAAVPPLPPSGSRLLLRGPSSAVRSYTAIQLAHSVSVGSFSCGKL